MLHKPEPPNASKRGYVPEHVFAMSQRLGRPLRPDERVHHKNGRRDDNSDDNLELWICAHPSGQRVADILKWAEDFVARYRVEKGKL